MHLTEATRILSGIPQDTIKGNAKKKLAELRQHFDMLVSFYDGNAFVAAAVPQPEVEQKPDGEDKPLNWKMAFSEVEHDLSAILTGDDPAAKVKEIDAGIRRQLEEFRLELELFFASGTLDIREATPSPPATPAPPATPVP